MSYVDAWFDRENDIIKVVERSNQGKREFRDIPVRYTFYYEDARGKFQSIYGTPLSRIVCRNSKDFRKEMAIHNNKKLYEAEKQNKNTGINMDVKHVSVPR